MESLVDLYNQLLKKADKRVADWFLMSSPLPTIAVVTLYLVVVIQGPKWMKGRPAFDLKPVILVYNFCLVLLSAYMVLEFMLSSWLAPGFSLSCQAMDYSDNHYSVRLAKASWWFYFSKIIELMDTVFFILRKKNNQVSFLHVYHHTTMPLLWWVGVKFVGGGEAFFSATINSGIHVLMYLYYMLSAMGPAMQPYLWWKKYMTTLQLLQFWTILFKTGYAVYLNCGYPVQYGFVLVMYMVSHIILFSNFYVKTYHGAAKHKKADPTDGKYVNGKNDTSSSASKMMANGSGKANAKKLRLD